MASDGEALFRAICEAPWENTPRLAYADWLEESGWYNSRRDPEEAALRAAFIRWQIRNPLGVSKKFEGCPERWQKELPKLSGVSWTWGWNRGFPSAVGFASVKAFRTHADAVFAAAPVSSLDVKRVTAETLPDILASKYLRRLEWFRPWGTIGDEGVTQIAVCENLQNVEDLILCDLGMSDVGMEALATATVFKRLKHLHFGGNQVTDRGVLALVASTTHKKLKEVGWPPNPITWKSLRPLRKKFHDPYTGGPGDPRMTSDGDNLFRAVCENAADDTPRLVYADWLQENGQPERAEFIRLQCEAWHLCPAYPNVTEARTAASRLLKQHGDAWHAELPAVPGVLWSDLFVHGFVQTAMVKPQRDVWAQVSPLFLATPLRRLIITNCVLGFLQALFGLTEIKRLKTLEVRGLLKSAASRRLLAEAAKEFPDTKFELDPSEL